MPEDVDLIEEDLEDLRILFHAEGEGLETEEIVAMCVPLSDLLTVLQLDTGILVNNLKQVWIPTCLPATMLHCQAHLQGLGECAKCSFAPSWLLWICSRCAPDSCGG